MKLKWKWSSKNFIQNVDAKINNKIESEDIIEMLKHIPNHLAIRLETNNIDETIKLMKSKTLIEKLQEQGIKFLYNGIEIEPRIIESKQDEDDFKNEVKEINAKRCRMNMDCDK